MTGEAPEDVAPDFSVDGVDLELDDDPEAERELEARLGYLEEFWPTLDETDPQRPVVALEIVTLRKARDALEDQ